MGSYSKTNRDKRLIPSPKNWSRKSVADQEKDYSWWDNLGMLVIPFLEVFEYILRHRTLDMAKRLVENGCGMRVDLWDITEENVLKKYEGGTACLWKLSNDNYSLSCINLFNNCGLGDGDEIGLYWDTRSARLMFKLLSKVRA